MLLFLFIKLEPTPGVRVTKVSASHPSLAHLEQVKDLVLERAALYHLTKTTFWKRFKLLFPLVASYARTASQS